MPAMPALFKRDRCYYDGFYDDYYDCDSAWHNWVRWVVVAVIVLGFFLLFFIFSCVTARRRRRMGQMPFYGTGWAAGRQPPPQYGYNGQPYYQNQGQNWSQPAPPYTPAPNGTAYDYYGQQNGIELQNQPSAPPPAHTNVPRAGDHVHQPPASPPPPTKNA